MFASSCGRFLIKHIIKILYNFIFYINYKNGLTDILNFFIKNFEVNNLVENIILQNIIEQNLEIAYFCLEKYLLKKHINGIFSNYQTIFCAFSFNSF